MTWAMAVHQLRYTTLTSRLVIRTAKLGSIEISLNLAAAASSSQP